LSRAVLLHMLLGFARYGVAVLGSGRGCLVRLGRVCGREIKRKVGMLKTVDIRLPPVRRPGRIVSLTKMRRLQRGATTALYRMRLSIWQRILLLMGIIMLMLLLLMVLMVLLLLLLLHALWLILSVPVKPLIRRVDRRGRHGVLVKRPRGAVPDRRRLVAKVKSYCRRGAGALGQPDCTEVAGDRCG
jgi:hypothetical protein